MKDRLDYITKLASVSNGLGYVLDIGAGKGSSSFTLACKGFQVDAVDVWDKDEFQWEDRNNHSKITRHHETIEDFAIHKKYNIILIINVIMFLKKDYVINDLLITLQNNLHSNGVICIAFLQTLAMETKQKLNYRHRFEEHEIIDALPGCTLIKSEIGNMITKTHPKHGEIEFYSKILTFQKNKG